MVASQDQLAVNLMWWNYMFEGVRTMLFCLLQIQTRRAVVEQDQHQHPSVPHPPLCYPLLSPFAFSSYHHGDCVPALAVLLSSTLDQNHGEKTQKETNLTAQAICSMDPVLELWTWNAVSEPLTLNQVLAAPLSSDLQHLLLSSPRTFHN